MSPAPVPNGAHERLLNRELSWLDFNSRVLALAEDRDLALLERVKFLAISSRNLDEFFQVRVAGLRAQLYSGVEARSPDGLTAEAQLVRIRERVLELIRRQEDLFLKGLVPELAQQDIRISDLDDVDGADRAELDARFEEIYPVLTPLSVDPTHRFPRISNLSLNLAVLVRDPRSDVHRFARVKVPPLLPRFMELDGGARLVPVEQLIAAHLERLFPGLEIVSHFAFRLTLDAEIQVDEGGAEDLLDAVESGLHRRHRLNDAVRLEVERGMSRQLRELIQHELDLAEDETYDFDGPLDLGSLWSVYALDRPDLKDAPWKPATQPRLSDAGRAGRSFFEVLEEGDVLVHHPYESFESSVEAFLTEAAADPDVLAIKQTLYRTAATNNPLLGALADAARDGKEVVALIELKARFDEGTNIEWARALEDAGVHVIYGVVGLKTHAKLALVVRREPGGIRRYCHLGTGNYNPLTARLYEDVGLFTASPEIGADVSELFNRLTGDSAPAGYRRLLVAPQALREPLLEFIRAEAAQPDGRIVMKMNSLSDPAIIHGLYEASQLGTEIDLVVRGICCLRPGVSGLSERIRVRSLVGRWLEHSRIYRFGSEARGPRYWIGSADMMGRNLDRRVEAIVPVDDSALQRRLQQVFDELLADDTRAWQLGPDGTWTPVQGARGRCAHDRLQELARERSARES